MAKPNMTYVARYLLYICDKNKSTQKSIKIKRPLPSYRAVSNKQSNDFKERNTMKIQSQKAQILLLITKEQD